MINCFVGLCILFNLIKDITTYVVTETQPVMEFKELCLGTGMEFCKPYARRGYSKIQEGNVVQHISIATSATGWSKPLDKHLSMSPSKTVVRVANSWTVLRVVRGHSTVHRTNQILKFGPFECQHARPSMMMMRDL